MSLRLLAFGCALLAVWTPASAATRNFSVTGFDRIRVDGPFRVRLTTAVAPFAKAVGTPAALDGVAIDVQGQTLVVRKNPSNWGSYPGQAPGPVEIAVGTHDLSKIWINGAGSLAVGKARGQTLDVSVQGPGSVAVDQLSVDTLRVSLTGTGSAVLSGSAAVVTAIVRGTAELDASALRSKDATVGAEGGAVVKLTATNSVKIDTQGTSTVELSGKPACTVRAAGSAVVSGCR